mmetsp:Transcript_7884/g.22324  ORF Transcript_7884/g.22324 Transcript_7884/m.22324 type:complete len:215 (+) Transcript_7884:3744-4388(+)
MLRPPRRQRRRQVHDARYAAATLPAFQRLRLHRRRRCLRRSHCQLPLRRHGVRAAEERALRTPDRPRDARILCCHPGRSQRESRRVCAALARAGRHHGVRRPAVRHLLGRQQAQALPGDRPLRRPPACGPGRALSRRGPRGAAQAMGPGEPEPGGGLHGGAHDAPHGRGRPPGPAHRHHGEGPPCLPWLAPAPPQQVRRRLRAGGANGRWAECQ